MSNKEKVAMVPRFRFPEFRQRGGWIPQRLKDACEVNPANSALPKRFVYIDLESVEAGKLTARKVINRDDAPSRAQRLLSPDDVIFQIVRPYQRNNFHFKVSQDLDHVASTGYAQLRAKDSADFLYQVVHVDDFVDRVIAKCTGSSYPAINSSDLADVLIALPGPDEQQKIADCLSSLDELIAAQTRKVDALKTHKKGLMQQLFPREGETQPRLRFPEFRDAGEWGVKTLQSFCRVGDIDHKMPSSVPEGIPYIMTGDFFGSNDIDFDNAKKISAEDYEQLSKKIRPEFGDIVIARYASVGAVRYINTNIKFLVSYSCATIKCQKSENSKYLYYIFQSDVIQTKIGLETNTSSQKNIGIDSIKKLNIFLPTRPEQQRIADCLTSLDDLITAATQELDTLKTHKRGLMQQLFPSAETVEA